MFGDASQAMLELGVIRVRFDALWRVQDVFDPCGCDLALSEYVARVLCQFVFHVAMTFLTVLVGIVASAIRLCRDDSPNGGGGWELVEF
jgi:hypothetical protein